MVNVKVNETRIICENRKSRKEWETVLLIRSTIRTVQLSLSLRWWLAQLDRKEIPDPFSVNGIMSTWS